MVELEKDYATKVIAPAVFVAIVLAAAWLAFAGAKGTLGPWYDPVVTKEEVDAAIWVDKNIPAKSLFAADLFACEMLVSAGNQVCTIGGAWELADNANTRFYENEQAFMSNSSQQAHTLFAKYRVQYVFVHPRTSFYAYGWKKGNITKFSDAKYFERVYADRGTEIYRVK